MLRIKLNSGTEKHCPFSRPYLSDTIYNQSFLVYYFLTVFVLLRAIEIVVISVLLFYRKWIRFETHNFGAQYEGQYFELLDNSML